MKVLSPPGRAPGGQETRHRWLVCLAVFWMYNTAMLWSLNVFGVSCEYGCWTGKSGHNDILKLHNKSWYMWHCTHHECYDSISQPTLCRYIRLPFSFLTIPLIHSCTYTIQSCQLIPCTISISEPLLLLLPVLGEFRSLSAYTVVPPALSGFT